MLVAVAQGRRVLYIEDNEANLALVRRVLEHSGYTVLEATTGERGLEMVATEKPDLVLLDLDLPHMSGFEVAARLKADPASANIPMIAISASVMKQERQSALDAGCVCFIEKPFDIAELRTAVADALAPDA